MGKDRENNQGFKTFALNLLIGSFGFLSIIFIIFVFVVALVINFLYLHEGLEENISVLGFETKNDTFGQMLIKKEKTIIKIYDDIENKWIKKDAKSFEQFDHYYKIITDDNQEEYYLKRNLRVQTITEVEKSSEVISYEHYKKIEASQREKNIGIIAHFLIRSVVIFIIVILCFYAIYRLRLGEKIRTKYKIEEL